MQHLLALVVMSVALAFLSAAAPAAEVLIEHKFDTAPAQVPADLLEQTQGRGRVLHIAVPAGTPDPGKTVSIPLPIEKLRGSRVFFGADVRTRGVSPRPNAWNGVKVMLVLRGPGGTDYPQPDIPVGTKDWMRYSRLVAIPNDTQSATLVLGLEKVSGEAWFDNFRVTLRNRIAAKPAAPPEQPIFRGHTLPRLRGAMAGTDLKEEDIAYFAQTWGGNLLRWQLVEGTRPGQDRPLEQYDQWLEEKLAHLDRVLDWAERYGVMIVVDLHSPPGGEAFSAGYVTARGRIFTDPAAQAKTIEVWRRIAQRYRGRQIIWGFDLMNEPDDSMLAEGCMDWHELAYAIGKAVRQVDPERTLIVEPNGWGGAEAFASFQPIDLPRVVYSYHMYTPSEFTHQGVRSKSDPVSYPGTIDGKQWNAAALEAAMRPAIDFASRYRVHMYVGEFSAIRTAPGDSTARYLADVISLFEKHGYDWSYHAYREWQGWSLEHEGPIDQPRKAAAPTDRQKVVTGWMRKNERLSH